VVVESDRAAARDYLGVRLDYVHLNPVRASLVAPGKGKGLLGFFWSSLAQGYAVAGRQRRPWMETEVGFELAGFAGTASGRKRLVETLERRASEEKGERSGRLENDGQTLNSTLAQGWYWGSESFRERLLGSVEKSPKINANRNYQTSRLGTDHAKVSFPGN